MKSSHSPLYGVFTSFLALVLGFGVIGCDLFNNSLADYFLDNTAIVEVTGVGGRPKYVLMANGTILIPPSDDEPVTILELALSNPRSLTVRQELLGVPPGKQITVRQAESTKTEVLIEGAVVDDEFDLTLAMQSPDGLRDFTGCNMRIRCVSFNTALSDFRVNEIHPLFDQDQYAFTVELPYETTEVTLEGIALDSEAALSLYQGQDAAGTLIASGSGRTLTASPAALSPGSNYFYLEVRAPGAVQGYAINVIRMQDPNKRITEFYFTLDSKRYGVGPGVEDGSGSISGTDITVTVPYGTDVSAMTASASHTGASISPDPATARSYAGPVSYTVTAEDGSTGTYTVTVNTGSQPEKALTAFNITGPVSAAGIIDEARKTVTVTVPHGTDVTAMTASASHTGVSISPEPATPRSYAGPVSYTISAADGSTETYTVTVKERQGVAISGIIVEGLPVLGFDGLPSSPVDVSGAITITIGGGVRVSDWYIEVNGPNSSAPTIHTADSFTAPAVPGFYNVNVIVTVDGVNYSGSFVITVQ